MLEILLQPFMQRALIAGVILATLLGKLGVFINMRKLSFLGDGIAHASLAGIALALSIGWLPLPTAIITSIILAISMFALERYSKLSGDVAIGVIFTTGMAIGIILLYQLPGFQPELMSYLFGNILTIRSEDLLITAILGTIIFFINSVISRNLTFIIIDPDEAYLHKLNPDLYNAILYVLTALTIVISIKMVGIILVSSLLITPSAIAQILAKNYKSMQRQSILWAQFTVLCGIILSVILDLPTGATIIITGTSIFIIAFTIKALSEHFNKP